MLFKERFLGLRIIFSNKAFLLFVSGVFEPQFLIVGTTIGLFLININTREVISTISFDHLYNNQIVEDILSAMVSTLMLSRSSYNGDINVLTQCMTDEKTAFFQVKFQSTIPLEDTAEDGDASAIAIVAQDSPKGFFKNIQKVLRIVEAI